MLILDDISSILCEEDVYFKWRNGAKKPIFDYIKAKYQIEIKGNEASKPNGGILSVSKSVLKHFENVNLKAKCFEILKEIYALKILNEQAMADELVFGILAYEKKLKFSFLQNANIPPYEANNDSIIIHAVSASKFFSSAFASLLFDEWWQNHKIYENITQQKYDFTIKKANLAIDSKASLYNLLLTLNFWTPMQDEISQLIAKNFNSYQMYSISPMKDIYYDIFSMHLKQDIFTDYILCIIMENGILLCICKLYVKKLQFFKNFSLKN